MNILIIGKPNENIVSAIQSSKHLDKLYIASNKSLENMPAFKFQTIKELIEKAKNLQIDIAINTDIELVYDNICEEFKNNKINLISINKKWLNLEKESCATKQLLNHYSINTPKLISIPISFPVTMKTKSSEEIIYSMQEVTEKLELKHDEKPYFEETLTGANFNLLLIWDGENVFYFNSPNPTTEVKEDRLDLLKTKLTFLLSDEHADFTGFLTVNLVWAKNDWYVKSFNAKIDEIISLDKLKADFLYILNSAIYQKLNEI